MHLVIDVGNTRTKYGLFNGQALEVNGSATGEPVYLIHELFEKYPAISAMIISSVNAAVDANLIPIPETIHHVILETGTPVPLQNNYSDKHTLGLDRLANAVGAVSMFPGRSVLVIDAGTCITYDLVEKGGIYFGGAISPGLQMRFNAMHSGTSSLPQLQVRAEFPPPEIGITTKGSMEAGAVWGTVHEINGMITAFGKQFNDLQVVLTGGNTSLFESALKSTIFADANFVLRGLHHILLYNLPEK